MPTPAEQHWEPIVRRARQSGVSIRSYARQQGINENTLSWWNWRLGDEVGAGAFVEVTVEPSFRPLRLTVGIVQLEVDAQSDLGLLRRVVEALS